MNEDDELANTEKPIIQLEIGGDVGVLAFRSLDEAAEWLRVEREFWSWLPAAASRDSSISNVHTHQCHRDGDLQTQLDQARQSTDAERRRQHIAAFESILRERYQNNRALISTSPKANFVTGLPDKVVAALALWHFMDKEPLVRNRKQSIATFLALAFEYGVVVDGAKYFGDAIDDIREKIQGEHEILRSQAGRLVDQYRETQEKIAVLHGDQRRQFDESQASRQASFDAQFAEAKEGLANIAETYDKKLSLQAAVTYLSEKAKSHRTAAIVWGIAALFAGAGFVALAGYIALSLFGMGDPPWHQLAVAGLAATLGFWLLRILVRLFLSNLHLNSDIRSRETLMTTYLALMREGGALKDDDRKLILQMLFRPTSDGLVRDDAAPPGPWEAVTRTLAGRS